MPAVSEAQRRLMWAAAGTKGGVDGVPQSVGKEFSKADKGGKLPERVRKKKGWVRKEGSHSRERAPRRERASTANELLYDHPRSKM